MPEKEWRVRWNLRAKTRLCPKCESPVRELGSLSGWLTPSLFVCEKCGYSGYLFVEVDPASSNG